MIERASLSPFGTARELFLAAHPEQNSLSSSDLKGLVLRLMERVRLYNLDGQLVQLALEMVQWEKTLEPEEAETLLLVITASLIMLQQGSTRLPLFAQEAEEYINSVFTTLLRDGDDQEQAVVTKAKDILKVAREILERNKACSVVGAYGEYKPLIFAQPYLYHHKLLRLEERFSERLTTLLSADIQPFDQKKLGKCLDEIDRAPYTLSREQRTTVLAAVNSPFTIISGGPGTGKTSVVVSILRVLLKLGISPENIALSAPTGKAAHRMGESIRNALGNIGGEAKRIRDITDPRTLHRLLGYSPSTGRFSNHEHNRLTEQFVFIDEGSMIDLFLMERLMRSLRDDARLVLIGDADQLPSVEAGAVFRDLLSAGENRGRTSSLSGHVVTLIENYRMSEKDPSGRNILSVAKAIKAGDGAPLFEGEFPDGISVAERVADLVFDRVELLTGTGSVKGLDSFLDSWYASRIKLPGGLAGLIRKHYRYGKDGFGERDCK
ncbi:MAG TPA: AAA family ATPase, partial [Dissulfurispiraceae bacterium]